jgi:hypothetical protein
MHVFLGPRVQAYVRAIRPVRYTRVFLTERRVVADVVINGLVRVENHLPYS